MTDGELGRAARQLVAAPVQAIGEIGLDYARDADRERQRQIFRAQLRIAERRELPVIVHCVKAFEDAMRILSEFSLPAVIFHGFIGSTVQAQRAVERGYFLSFGMRGFASPRTVEAMRNIPLTHIFLETDDDPTPIKEVYRRAAETLEISVHKLTEQMRKNYGMVISN